MLSKDWYSPGAIRFKVKEALWLVQNLGLLQEGQWPPDVSSYIDLQGIKGGRQKSPFETAADFYAEITDRLERCGRDGLILEAVESWGKSDESLAKYLSLPVWSIRKRLKSALGYVASGSARRWHKTNKREAEDYQEYKGRKRRRS